MPPRAGLKALLLFIFLMPLLSPAQTVYSTNFEGSNPPPGWTFNNAGNGNGWTLSTDATYAKSGSNALVCPGTPSAASVAWAITPGLTLTKGTVYKISFNKRSIAYPSQIKDMKLTIGTGNTVADQSTLLQDFGNAYFGNSYTEADNFFMAPASGTYYLGFDCNLNAGIDNIYIDDATITQNPSKVVYVNASAVGANNGTSWANAFTSLAAAINAVVPGDTLKVAKGIYKPTNTKDISKSFNLPDYVVALGGYPNTGNPGDADRNWSVNETILSGELDPTDYWARSIHVVNLYNTSEHCVMDGFVIRDGFAITQDLPTREVPNHGGGMILLNSAAVIRNCRFASNRGYTEGVSLSIESNSAARISNCFFVNPGGDYPDIESNIYVMQNSTANFSNCVFANNRSNGLLHVSQSNVNLSNCTFSGNDNPTFATPNLGLVYAQSGSSVSIINSIFFGNTSGLSKDSADLVIDSSTLSISRTITQAYNYGDPAFLGQNPKFRDSAHVAGADGLFFTADDGLQLVNPCSPAMNRGDNAASNSLTTDILGKPRVFAGIVDLGAYEVQTSPEAIPSTVYVNSSAKGTNDGSSWANAFTNLQSALQYCSDTIRVAAGTYSPSDSDKLVSFWLENHRVLLGGYPASDNPGDARRDPSANPTVLDGLLPSGKGQQSTSIIRGRAVDSSAVVDGFVISRSSSPDNYDYDNVNIGAVFLTEHAAPVISNCKFSNNISIYGAGMVTKDSSHPQVLDCVFEKDSATAGPGGLGSGGAIACFSGSAPVFVRCAFRNNSTWIGDVNWEYGGAIYNDHASPIFDSCVFLKNRANNYGGAIYNNYSDPVIKNCQFYGNNVTPDAGGLWGSGSDIGNDHSSPRVTNCLFSDSAAAQDGGSISNLDSSSPVFTRCIIKNASSIHLGGAVYNENSSPTFISTVFDNHVSYYYNTGTVYSKHSQTSFVNCLAIGTNERNAKFLVNDVNSIATMTNCVIVPRRIEREYQGSTIINNINGSTTTVANCIFRGDASPTNVTPDVHNDLYSSSIVTNSYVQAYGSDGQNGNRVGIDPGFINDTLPEGVDGVFFSADDGLQLKSCSPAIDAGSNAAVRNLATDITGGPRIIKGVVDIGAYEFNGRPGVTISRTGMATTLNSDGSICSGTPVTFAASAVNEGTAPIYQWLVKNMPVGSNKDSFTTNSLHNLDQVKVMLTSNAACLTNATASSDSILMAVHLLDTPMISITGNTQLKAGESSDLSSIVTGAGASPGYQWQDSTVAHDWENLAGAAGPSYTVTPAMGDRIRCKLVSNAICSAYPSALSNVLVFKISNPTGTTIPIDSSTGVGVHLYPNPVTSTLVLDSLSLADHWQTLEIRSANGLIVQQVVVSGLTQVVVPVGYLQNGIYFAVLYNGRKRKAVEFLKQ